LGVYGFIAYRDKKVGVFAFSCAASKEDRMGKRDSEE
jgi:hypothetical protein